MVSKYNSFLSNFTMNSKAFSKRFEIFWLVNSNFLFLGIFNNSLGNHMNTSTLWGSSYKILNHDTDYQTNINQLIFGKVCIFVESKIGDIRFSISECSCFIKYYCIYSVSFFLLIHQKYCNKMSTRITPPFMMIPYFAATPEPISTGVGAAKATAQGHDIIKTIFDLLCE